MLTQHELVHEETVESPEKRTTVTFYRGTEPGLNDLIKIRVSVFKGTSITTYLPVDLESTAVRAMARVFMRAHKKVNAGDPADSAG